MEFVIDSSVVLKSLLVESESDAADALVTSHRRGLASLIAPDFICAEVANALWKRSVLKDQITADEALDIFADFLSLKIRYHSAADLGGPALQRSLYNRHPVYDAIYVALAESTGAPLVTADERLAKRFNVPFVIPLSRFRP